ncbi:Probable protein phosphatase 2C 8 [Linum perenne]
MVRNLSYVYCYLRIVELLLFHSPVLVIISNLCYRKGCSKHPAVLLASEPVISRLQVGVSATPDIHSFELTEKEHFIILGCDGLWGVFGASDAVQFVQKLLNDGLTAAAVSRRLVKEAVLERRCQDNCTAIVIVFRHK